MSKTYLKKLIVVVAVMVFVLGTSFAKAGHVTGKHCHKHCVQHCRAVCPKHHKKCGAVCTRLKLTEAGRPSSKDVRICKKHCGKHHWRTCHRKG